MADRPLVLIKTLPHDNMAIEVKLGGDTAPGPVMVPRCDLLYAMLCDEGVSIAIPGKLISGGEGDV
mgnify:CR=1 FL=1